MPANPRTDAVALVVSLLKTNWTPANTGSLTPDIVDGRSGGKYARQANGWIEVYEDGPYTRSRDDTHGDFKTHHLPLTIEAHHQGGTAGAAKLVALLAEVERILNAVRNNPDPAGYWDWIEDLGQTPLGQYPQETWAKQQVELWANSIATAV